MSTRTRHAAAAALLGIAVLAATTALPSTRFTSPEPGADVGQYERYAEQMLDGKLPYDDFFFEYPPLALPLLVVPEAVAPDDYPVAWRTLVFVLLVVLLAVLSWTLTAFGFGRARLYACLAVTGAMPLLLGPVLFNRYDALPALLTLTVLLAAGLARHRVAAVSLALAAAAKIWPVVVAPLLVLHWLRDLGARRTRSLVGLGFAAFTLVLLPFAIVGPGGLEESFEVQLTRPLQLESLGASLLLVSDRLGLYDVTRGSGISIDLSGALPDALALAHSLVQAGAILLVLWLFARSGRSTVELAAATAAGVAAFVAFGKVLSPQFLIWLIPLVPFALGRAWIPATALLATAAAMTHVWFPNRYDEVVHGERLVWLVLARNLTLVALFTVLAVSLGRRARERPRAVRTAARARTG